MDSSSDSFVIHIPLFIFKGFSFFSIVFSHLRRPEQDKTVAEYLGKDKGTISYHNKNLNKKFRELLGIKDTKPVKEN